MLVDMFERFTDRGRRVLVLALEEARRLGHNVIGTEHILLGLLDEGEGVAAKALASLGIRVEPVRKHIEEMIGPLGSSTTGSPAFTARAKKVLELALREALQLGHNYIGTEHLLLGLVREGEGGAVQVLVSLGADLARVRYQVIYLLGHPTSDPDENPMTGAPQPTGGPRCPACRSRLEGHVGYRVLPVHSVDSESASEILDVVFVYCLHCQVVIAHTPTTALGDQGLWAGPAAPSPQVQPAIGERVIAEGVTDRDWHWSLRAGGDDESYSTMLQIEDQSGVLSNAGMAGPKLWNDDLLNVYTGYADNGPLAIVLRTDPSIVRAVLVTQPSIERDLAPCGEGPIDDLRFYVGFAWPETTADRDKPKFGLIEVRGLDADNLVRETYDLTFWDRRST
jgi:hypothetical protein